MAYIRFKIDQLQSGESLALVNRDSVIATLKAMVEATRKGPSDVHQRIDEFKSIIETCVRLNQGEEEDPPIESCSNLIRWHFRRSSGLDLSLHRQASHTRTPIQPREKHGVYSTQQTAIHTICQWAYGNT